MEKVTVEQLKLAKMHAGLFLDSGNEYQQVYVCADYPEVQRVARGPRGRGRGKHVETIYVNGVEVPHDWQAICDAINAFRSRREPNPVFGTCDECDISFDCATTGRCLRDPK